jgi:LmbE family N-acetylglucosaminyl deacetylase
MKSILLSPHDDDQALFAAITCLREKQLVVIWLDSYIQPARGERGCSAMDRAMETFEACKILGCEVFRMGRRDDYLPAEPSWYIAADDLARVGWGQIERIYAPAVQRGNHHHDALAFGAMAHWGNKVIQYTTYTKTQLYTEGDIEVVPTLEELELKNRALDCYRSQIRINRPHFDAVRGKSEWLMR